MSDIKIFVSHRIDQESVRVDNPLFYDVRCGAVFDKKPSDIPGDNTGDNISEKRMTFCELTVQYWAWKNVKADYYGLCHYRRYFSFSSEMFPINEQGQIFEHYLCTSNIEKFQLQNTKKMQEIINANDIVVAEYNDVRKIYTPQGYKKSVWELWNAHENLFIDTKSINNILELIKIKYPELYKDALKYMHGHCYRGYNCFVMRKELFFKLCQFEFDILFELENDLDMTNWSSTKKRTCGFMAEILFGIYIYHLENKKKYKIKNLQLVFFENAEKPKLLLPAYKINNVPIIMLSNNHYVPYLSVLIKSILNNCSFQNNYDIIVLHKEITSNNQKLLNQMCSDYSNVSLRFFDFPRRLANISCFETSFNFDQKSCYRLLLPWVLNAYDKAIVMHCDIVLKADIAKLYQIDIKGMLAGGIKDIVFQGMLNKAESNIIDYCKNKMNNPYNYVNTGVLLMNLKEFRKIYTEKHIIDLVQNNQFKIQEQDLLNVVMDDKIKILECGWNFYIKSNPLIEQYLNNAPAESILKYDNAEKSPFLVHYASLPKPWQYPEIKYADEFWNIARTTPFYEIIIARMGIDFSNKIIFDHQTQFHSNLLQIIIKNIKHLILWLFPKGTKRYRKLKIAYFKLHGWSTNNLM